MKSLIQCPECRGDGAVLMYVPDDIQLIPNILSLPFKKCTKCMGVGEVLVEIDIREFNGVGYKPYSVGCGC